MCISHGMAGRSAPSHLPQEFNASLSLPCAVTFVDKDEGQPSTGFCYPKNFPFGSPFGKEEGQPPPLSDPPPRSSAPMRAWYPHRVVQSSRKQWQLDRHLHPHPPTSSSVCEVHSPGVICGPPVRGLRAHEAPRAMRLRDRGGRRHIRQHPRLSIQCVAVPPPPSSLFLLVVGGA